MTDVEVYGGATLLGAVSGMRSLAAPAVVSQVSYAGLLPMDVEGLNFLKHPATAQTSFVLGLAEVLADKLPNIPSRISPGPLIVRALAGGFSGAAFTASKKRSVYVGAVVGSLAAIGAAYGAYHLRRFINRKLHVPDPIVAVAEDAAMVACASVVVNRLHAAKRAG